MEKKEITITPEMYEKYEKAKQFFLSRTIGRSGNLAPDYCSIVGCGILKEPTTHFAKEVNDIWLYVTNINREGTDIVEVVNFEMTIVELLMFKKAVDDIIDIYGNVLKRKVPSNIIEGFEEQKEKLNRFVTYKFEKK